jgi:DNA-directed RNA polymerase subunit RPC12/RpoP
MEIEQLNEMFPSKSEQRIAQKVVETLGKSPDSDALEISELMSPNKSSNARTAECNGLGHILDGLRALGVISCTMDHFRLSSKSKGVANHFYGSKPKKHNSPLQRGQIRYVVFICEKCGAAVGSRSSQRSAICKTCNHKNVLDGEHKVLLKTNSFLELQAAIQQAKIERASNKVEIKSYPEFEMTVLTP